jgi:hypothetical protein
LNEGLLERAGGRLRNLWAYAYQIVPPQPASRLGAIRTILRDGIATASRGVQFWAGRLVLGRRVTSILVVSDARGRSHAASNRLEAELKRLGATFSVTAALEVTSHAPRIMKRLAPARSEAR